MDSSPWQQSLGIRLDGLSPQLRTYFSVIPEGSVGRGSGTFDRVGTPRVWLWPVLFVLGRQGVLFPAWRRRVPLTVENRPMIDAAGNSAVFAVRTFHFRRGRLRMIDAITVELGRLVDHLGTHRRYSATLDPEVVDGELHLRSTRLRTRIGRFAIPIPNVIAPVVMLTERFDADSDRQHVSVAIDSPQLGRLYEYSGSFSYRVEHEGAKG